MDPNTIEVFVSCPGDVNKEKAIVKNACDRMNQNLLQSGDCDIRFLFRDFTEVIGSIGKRPQEIINDCIVGYNIYIGILYMRFGTPTGAINPVTGLEYQSGTEEEFEYAWRRREKGQEPSNIYFFFKDQVGSKNTKDHSQAGKVLQFKERLMSENWVNGFKTAPEFERLFTQLLTRIMIERCGAQKIETKKIFIQEELKSGRMMALMASWVPSFPHLDYYIPRSVSKFKKGDKLLSIFGERLNTSLLRDVLLTETKIVLLGNAGSGKSIELQQLANYYKQPDTPYTPVYRRFNTYINEDIETFLPEGWQQVNNESLVVFLDGLDEVQPQHFSTAVRKIIAFSEKHPGLRIVVSCRTNFYELPDEGFSGTITGFQPYLLNDISIAQINSYVTNHFGIDGNHFIRQAYDNHFFDLIQKPFFLNILLKHYKQYRSFEGGRLKMIEESITSAIRSDQEHFKNSEAIPTTKNEILKLLEKIAYVMELCGKNFLSDDELEWIISKQEKEQLKRFSAFARNAEKQQWMFEHNNIQEFLAARILARQSFENLIKIISFPPSHTKVKPTWVNTISFFISISDAALKDQLIAWLIDKDPEIIVRFEPDRISKQLRIRILKNIFNFYKQKNIWIHSNKFAHKDLAHFAESEESIDFLLNEISNQSNTHIVRLNAVSVLDNFDLNRFDPSWRQRITKVMTNFLEEDNLDGNVIHSLLYGMANMRLTDKDTVDHFVKKYFKRKNQYVRAGLYKLINMSDYLEDYIDIFLDGLMLSEMQDSIEDRESVNLADESWQLEEGLKNIKSPSVLKKVLHYFDDPADLRKMNLFYRGEILKSLLEKAFAAYDEDASMFDDIYTIYVNSIKTFDRPYSETIIKFFERTGKKWEVFKKIWKDPALRVYQRDVSLENLLDRSIVNNFVNEFALRDFTNDDVIKLHQLMAFHFHSNHEHYRLVELLEIKVNQITNIPLQRPKFIDWGAVHRKKSQDSFNILFSGEQLLKEVKRIFEIQDKEELNSDDLWQIRTDRSVDLEDYFVTSAIDLLRDRTMHGATINYQQIEEWVMQNPDFPFYQINEIYEHLHGSFAQFITATEEQKQFIKNWTLNAAKDINYEDLVQGNGYNTFRPDWRAQIVWFFVHFFNIQVPEEYLLNFTLYYDFENKSESAGAPTIESLEKFVPKRKIEQRVIQNLSGNIKAIYVWVSNATYAINNHLKSSYTHILRDLKNTGKEDHHRNTILQLYFRTTNDAEALQDLLTEMNADHLKWDVVHLLIQREDQHPFLKDYLKKIIDNRYEHIEAALNASKYLMQMNEMAGLRFATEFIKTSAGPNLDFRYKIPTLPNMKTREAVPLLIDLLEIAIKPAYQFDRFHNLDGLIYDAFYSIGIQSEENFITVKVALEKFIDDHRDNDNLNFIHSNIKRIEEQLYMKKAQSYTVEQAISEFNKTVRG